MDGPARRRKRSTKMLFEFAPPVRAYLRSEKRKTKRTLKWIVENAVRHQMEAAKR